MEKRQVVTDTAAPQSSMNEKLAQASLKASRTTSMAVIFLATVIAFSLSASGYALYDRFESTNERRADQEKLNERFEDIIVLICANVEGLKRAERERAIVAASRERLEETATILGIPITPRLLEIVARNKAETLRRFKQEPCPPKPRTKG